MTTQITLPHLGENIESGDVLSILVSEGDTVAKEQELIEIETDKATMPVPSPQSGKIVKLLVSEGDTINVGAALMEIEQAETASAAPSAPAAVSEVEPPQAKAPPAPAVAHGCKAAASGSGASGNARRERSGRWLQLCRRGTGSAPPSSRVRR